MMKEHTGMAPAAHAQCEGASPRPAKAAPKRVPRNASMQQWKKQCRQLQGQVAQLEERLKRQSADSYGLQMLYDQLVNEIKHHRDMLQLDSFDADKSSLVYTQAWRRFMAGDALDYQTHRHTNSRSRPSLL
ncbi:hypothetical protein CSZ94_11270 [Janthinobacterium sp. ROICE36]|uniref:hypothetical protein n=1 Tax=Janthinobacterium sp. ROICE36 TaxID=2048670 RepID=UPI000CA829F0|nr:hypothetical protein [Janthinobacterium sp. ROICE36]PLY42229.1 hypothetical protein CSZ94_11270 [Janthinobacterium sp. ROICE36]